MEAHHVDVIGPERGAHEDSESEEHIVVPYVARFESVEFDCGVDVARVVGFLRAQDSKRTANCRDAQ